MLTNSAQAAQDRTPLGYGDYLRFSKLIYDRYGLFFSDKRRADLERGLRQAFASSTCISLDEYFDVLQSADDAAIHLEQLVNAITVSETHFFRNSAQFDALYKHVLPDIIKRRQHLRTLRIWSAGCASGEEPYSIAMLLRELLPDIDDWTITILGTDINSEVINRAKKGIYGQWAFREERANQWRGRYFRPVENRYELIPEVRNMVTFNRLNLAGENYPTYETNTMFMDLILCRNVIIYFSQIVTQALVDRFYKTLVNGGWLVVGHSEHSIFTYQNFQAHNFPNAIVYQRTGQPTPLPNDWTSFQQDKKVAPLPVITPQPAPKKAVELTRPRPALPPTPEVQNVESDPLSQALELIDYGHLEQARDVLLKAIQQKPRQAPISALLGRVYADLGYWDEAEKWCLQAVGSDKLYLEAYYTLALVLQHKGQLPQAIEMMKKVVYVDCQHALGHFSLANLYHSHNQFPQALKSLDNARRLLEQQSPEGILPDSNGVTVGRLREAVTHLGQQWRFDANGI